MRHQLRTLCCPLFRSLSLLFFLLLTMTPSLVYSGPFSLQQEGNNLKLLYKGTPLITEFVSKASSHPEKEKRHFTQNQGPDGGTVYNLWCDEFEYRFRTEVAINKEGTVVEATYLSEAPAHYPETMSPRLIQMKMPLERFINAKVEGYVGRATKDSKAKGVIDAKMPRGNLLNNGWRFLTTKKGKEKLIFDFNPIGAGDFISIYKHGAVKGNWQVCRQGNELMLVGGSVLPNIGGMTGAKLRICEGEMSDYDKLHALRAFTYTLSMPAQYQFSFGAKVHGKNYTEANDLPYTAERKFGWTKGALTTQSGGATGALYSSVKGKDNCFRITGVPDGLWLITLGIGNYQGRPQTCCFSILEDAPNKAQIALKANHAQTATLPVWITKGEMNLQFQGDFQLSTLCLQRLMTSWEDFSVRRGIWVTDGFEPTSIFRNEDYKPEPKFSWDIQDFFMPTPGQEMAAPRKEIPVSTPCAAPRNRPGMDWRDTLILGEGGTGNSSTLAEYDTQKSREALWQIQERLHSNALIMSGLHSRHTYQRHMKRSQEFMKNFSQEAHKHNLKVIDHHDTTLLWNLDSGFRVMAERLGEVNRSTAAHLPSYQLCLTNPDFNRKYQDYLMEIVKGGIDGFMIDESTYYNGFCGCQYCSRKFHKDTGWYLPLDETSPFFTNKRNLLYRTFCDWRKIQVGNWWVDLRKRIDAINPSVSLMVYTTHYGFTSNYASLGLGADLFQCARGADFLGTEIMSRNILRSARAVVPYRKAKNLLSTAYDIPVWGLVTTQPNTLGTYFGWGILTMHHQSTWISAPIKEKKCGNYKAFMNNYPALRQGKDVAKVALLFSSNTRDWQTNGGFQDELFGTAQTLEEMHIPYEIIGEMSLTPEKLNKYKVLIAGGSSCLTLQECQTLLDFAEKGGTLYLTCNAGFCNPQGELHPKWPFAQALKFTPSRSKIEKCPSFTFQGETTEFPNKLLLWRLPTSQVKCQLLATGNLPTQMAGFVHTTWGKGEIYYNPCYFGRYAYASEGTPGRVWDFQRNEVFSTLHQKILATVIGKNNYWTTNLPLGIYSMVYQDGTKTYIHLLNGQGSLNNPVKVPMANTLPAIPFPPLKEALKMTLPLANVSRAYAVSPDFEGEKPLELQKLNAREATITLPPELLKVYTFIVVE